MAVYIATLLRLDGEHSISNVSLPIYPDSVRVGIVILGFFSGIPNHRTCVRGRSQTTFQLIFSTPPCIQLESGEIITSLMVSDNGVSRLELMKNDNVLACMKVSQTGKPSSILRQFPLNRCRNYSTITMRMSLKNQSTLFGFRPNQWNQAVIFQTLMFGKNFAYLYT